MTLERGDDGGSVNIGGGAAARKIVGRTGEALQEWSQRNCAAQPFYKLVSDVAGGEIRKDERVGAPGNARAGSFEMADALYQSSIRLQLAVDFEKRLAPSHELESLTDLFDCRLL